jgi:hypothetical protein
MVFVQLTEDGVVGNFDHSGTYVFRTCRKRDFTGTSRDIDVAAVLAPLSASNDSDFAATSGAAEEVWNGSRVYKRKLSRDEPHE